MLNKFKSYPEDDRWFTLALMTLLVLVAFGLGRLSAGTEWALSAAQRPIALISTSTAIRLLQTPDTAGDSLTIPWESQTAASVIGSRSGTRYYPVTCRHWERISPENRLVFVDASRARAAGYTIAVGCRE